ncbi:hypothetical protein [Erwinia sp. LJJL01]|uniref:hypothetical protein n=1 Tax=Erwinia sp. LJJL01 TaxID=3391839 RepID=UPI001061C7B0
MEQFNNSPNAATSWAQIDKFKIRHVHQPEFDGSVKLFNNGRQQLTFEIDVRALDASGKEVLLNPEALSYIRLIDYHTGEEIPHGNGFTGNWYSSFTHRGYEWNHDMFSYIGLSATENTEENSYKIPNEEDIPKELSATGVILRDLPVSVERAAEPDLVKMSPVTKFFLSCSAPSGINRTFAAKITSPDGSITVTTNSREAPEGDPSGDGQGKFNSFVTVIPVQLKNFDISCYCELLEVGGEDVLNNQLVHDAKFIFFYEGKLYCEPVNGMIIDFNLALNYPGYHTYFSLYNDAGKDDRIELMYTYVGQPGEEQYKHNWPKYLTYNGDHDVMSTDEFTRYHFNRVGRPEKGKVIIGGVFVKVDYVLVNEPYGGAVRNYQEKLYLYDIYGNGHPVGIKIDKTGVRNIVPFKW